MTSRLVALLRREDGFGPVETAIAVTAVILLIPLMIAFGRMAKANTSVDAAAFMAARAASISRTGGEAQGAADAAAAAQLAQDGVSCDNRSVSVDTSGFGTEPGQTALVAVSVTCRAELGDLPVPGMPSTKAFTGQYTSVIDTYRGRS